MQRFHATFFEESREGLEAMESGLLQLEQGNRDPELVNAIFRAAHSIKGGAATFGFDAVAALTHVLETLLDELRAGKREITFSAVDAMLASVDVLRGLLAEVETGRPADPQASGAVLARLHDVLGGDAAPPSSAVPADAPGADPAGWTIGFTPAPSLFMSGNDPLRILRELDRLAPLDVTCRMEGLPDFDRLDPLVAHLHWDLVLTGALPRSAVDEVFAWIEDDCELDIRPVLREVAAVPAATAATAATASAVSAVSAASATATPVTQDAESSIRVGTDKIDGLINLVGELVITQSMLKQIGSLLDPAQAERLCAGLEQLERNTRDLQEAVIGVRMLPVDAVFRRFPRLVRDLSTRLGKQVVLRTTGEGTELDKGLIEKVADPLVHLVRNAIDHGLETPDTRRAAGKDPTGSIALAASHQGGHIVIEVEDDGRGLDRDRILAKAAERGLAVPENPSDAQVWDLIFQPGFSTADAVTDLSGRGVGMDVVRRNIQGLGGDVRLESRAGAGTRVVIRLPLTLAILDGMTVAVGSETLVLPLTHVIEATQPQADDIRTVHGEGRLLRVRGEYVPLLSLRALYGDGRASEGAPVAVLVEGEGRRLALEVDELIGQQQVVVKSIERNYRRVDGISGATILGDGRVALIIDVAALARAQRIPKAA